MTLWKGSGEFGKISGRRGSPDNDLVDALGDLKNGEREALLLYSLKGRETVIVNGNSLSERCSMIHLIHDTREGS